VRKLWREHRRPARLLCAILSFLILGLVVPYLIPLGKGHSGVPPDALVGVNGRYLDIDGVSMYVEEENPESPAETIVFIHGLGGSTFSWRHNVSFFADRGYRVIGLDMKGFGLSHKDFPSDYSHRSQAQLLARVLDEMGVERAYLAGHSLGGSVMLHFAYMHPEKVKGLVSVAGAVSIRERSFHPGALLRFPPFKRAAEVFLTRYTNRERVRAILESACQKDIITEEVLDGYYNRIVTGHWWGSLLAMTRDMNRNAITFELEDFAFPTLVIWGENDTWIGRVSIDRWRERIPSAGFHVMPGVGHLPMEEDPDSFNSTVLAFLESVGE
jgi:pimeloyl-ACP methyl ester carboxylesterase